MASIPSNKAYEIDCKPYTTLMTVYQLQAMHASSKSALTGFKKGDGKRQGKSYGSATNNRKHTPPCTINKANLSQVVGTNVELHKKEYYTAQILR